MNDEYEKFKTMLFNNKMGLPQDGPLNYEDVVPRYGASEKEIVAYCEPRGIERIAPTRFGASDKEIAAFRAGSA